MVKIFKKKNYAKGIKETLAIYRIRNNSHSRNKKKLLKPQWKNIFYRKVENLNILISTYLMIVWAY
jgi:hypothetical protein